MLIVGENESFSDCSVLTLWQVKKCFTMRMLMLSLLMAVGLSLNLYSVEMVFTENKITPVILQGETKKQPRSEQHFLVDCYYQAGKIYVQLSGDDPCDIHVCVTNMCTGEQFHTIDGEISTYKILNVSDASGGYHVEVRAESILLYGYYQL